MNVPTYETRQATRIVHRPVQDEQTRTVMVPETRTRLVNYLVQKPVYETQTQEFTVNVPTYETREVMRTECVSVPVTRSRTVMVPETRT